MRHEILVLRMGKARIKAAHGQKPVAPHHEVGSGADRVFAQHIHKARRMRAQAGERFGPRNAAGILIDKGNARIGSRQRGIIAVHRQMEGQLGGFPQIVGIKEGDQRRGGAFHAQIARAGNAAIGARSP
jgi:hypothetical protein